jgi:hypothetical protein
LEAEDGFSQNDLNRFSLNPKLKEGDRLRALVPPEASPWPGFGFFRALWAFQLGRFQGEIGYSEAP